MQKINIFKGTIYIALIYLNAFYLSAQDTISILFIGNSYTFANTGVSAPELPLRLKEMGHLFGKTILTDFAGAGGVTLEKTWKSGKAVSKISNGKYDYVVLQEHSLGTIRNNEKFENYARKFSELISENHAKPILYMTWGRQSRSGMIDTISNEYIKAAKELNAVIAPCGFAWDMAGSQYPAIPLYWSDLSHPRPEGVLLNTFVFYNTLFGEIPSEPLYNFEFRNLIISEDTARKLLNIANLATKEINYQMDNHL
jgi:hypothetical protein